MKRKWLILCFSALLLMSLLLSSCGGNGLGGDWNPDQPTGFKMYPLALDLIKSSLAELDRQQIAYRIEGFMWHQGENDMFEEGAMDAYGKNLKNFLASWRAKYFCDILTNLFVFVVLSLDSI